MVSAGGCDTGAPTSASDAGTASDDAVGPDATDAAELDSAVVPGSGDAPDARSPAGPCVPAGGVDATTVFFGGVAGYNVYRIPSVARTSTGRLLVFAEGRPSVLDPGSGEIDVVMRRSDDCGRTWGPLQVLADAGARDAHNPTSVVTRRRDGTEVVWLFFNVHPAGGADEFDLPPGLDASSARLFAISSRDEGETWSPPVELTAAVKDASWRLASAGPGGAVQLRWGVPGRIISPGWFTDDAGGGCFVFYSDDDGETWARGGMPPRVCNETQLIELTDGSLLLDARQLDGSTTTRQTVVSRDGGATWEEASGGLPMTPVMSSLARMAATRDGDGGDLLVHTGLSATGRVDLTAWVSTDEATSWTGETVLIRGFAQYSQPVPLGPCTFGVIFESAGRPDVDAPGAATRLNIRFARVDVGSVFRDAASWCADAE